MQLFKPTITPKQEYHLVKDKGKYYLYDGDTLVMPITKIYEFKDFIDEYFDNECLDILEFFECNGVMYVYFYDEECAPSDYISRIPETTCLRIFTVLQANYGFLFEGEKLPYD